MMAKASPEPEGKRWLLVSIVLVLILGGLYTLWTAHRTEERMRADLLQQARSIAAAIDPVPVTALSGTADDIETPAYRRLKRQLGELRQAYPDSRFLYLMGRDSDDRVFFFVDCQPVGSADESPAGEVFDEATENTHRVFTSGTGFVSAPFTDRWGTWVSALTPLTDPDSGRVIAVLGMDIDAAEWRQMVVRELPVPLGFTVAFLLILVIGRGLLSRRDRLVEADRRGHPLRHAEAAIVATCGLTLTLLLALEFAALEQRTRQHTFTHLAEGNAARMIDTLHDVQHYHLEGLTRLLAIHPDLSEADFRFHTGYLARNTAVRAWAWAPAEAPDEARFPIHHVVPGRNASNIIGYDPGSDPSRRAALETAIHTGLATATDPVRLLGTRPGRTGVMVFQPVFSTTDPSRLLGLALVVLRPDVILRQHRDRTETTLEPGLYQLDGMQAPVSLASTAADPLDDLSFNAISSRPDQLAALIPVLAFGRTYAVITRPGPLFETRFPKRAFAATLLAGTLTTMILAVLIGFLGNRRFVLEQHVRARTAELRANHELLNKLSAQVPGVIYQFLLRPDGSSCFPYSSAAIESVYGVDADAVRDDSAPLFQRIHPDDRPGLFCAIRESAERLTPWRAEYRVIMPDEKPRWCEGHAAPERLPDGSTLWHGFMTEITERKQLEAELTALASTDPLTGLPNRRSFFARLEQEFARLQRFNRLKIAILMFDLDYFKRINDTHGHAVGDEVLRHFAGLLGRNLRKTDLAGRLGGEEFAVMLVGSSLANARRFAERIRAQLAEDPPRLGESRLPLSTSIGITLLAVGDSNPELAVSRADTALYQAKQSGRDRAEVALPDA